MNSFITSCELDQALTKLWHEECHKNEEEYFGRNYHINSDIIDRASLILQLFLRQFAFDFRLAWILISSRAQDVLITYQWFGLNLQAQTPVKDNIIRFKPVSGSAASLAISA